MNLRVVGCVVVLVLSMTTPCTAQEVRGLVLDESSGVGVATAGVFLLDEARAQVAVTIADSLGRYSLRLPGPGRFLLRVQRLGYADFESPLLEATGVGTYDVDLEVTPEPIGLDPFVVTVRNEQMETWLRLRMGGNPNAMFGFRAMQGQRLNEAKLKSDDNTELLRWLYIPISHGRRVCVVSPIDGCGQLYIDNIWTPNEHIESVDMESITAVVTFIRPPSVWLFTSGFDWSRQPRQ